MSMRSRTRTNLRLAARPPGDITADTWEGLRTLFAERAPLFVEAGLPGADRARVRFVSHHVAHAASAYLAGPYRSCAVMVFDGRGERGSYLAGNVRDGALEELVRVDLPSSLGLVYEGLSRHLGYRAGSDEYKIMALASYGEPRHLDAFRELIRLDGRGGFVTETIDWTRFAPPGTGDGTLHPAHADLASSVQCRLEEVELGLARWLHEQTGANRLAMAGGVALELCGQLQGLRGRPVRGRVGAARRRRRGHRSRSRAGRRTPAR